MPRRPTVARKSKYEETLVGTALTMDQFTNKLMRGGKRQLASRILEDALAKAEQQAGRSGVEVLGWAGGSASAAGGLTGSVGAADTGTSGARSAKRTTPR